MKLGIWNQRKILTIALSTAFTILMTSNGMARDQQPPQGLISIEARLIEMPRLAADELFKEQGGLPKAYVINEKTLGAIRDMVIKNKAQIVSQSKIVTRSGSNCKNRSVREVIYPTEYAVRRSDATNSVKALPDIIIPAEFETREVGTILDITPTIGPDNKIIELMCLFQRVRLSAYPNKIITGKTEVEQPVFIAECVTTQFAMQSGTTALVAVFDAISDQAKQEKVSENIILVLMTTCVVPVN